MPGPGIFQLSLEALRISLRYIKNAGISCIMQIFMYLACKSKQYHENNLEVNVREF